MREASLWPTEQPWEKCDETSFIYQPPPATRQKPPLTISTKPMKPVGEVVCEIINTNDRFQLPEKFQKRNLNIDYKAKPVSKNDSYLWTAVTNNSLSTISETSSPPMSPLKSPELYTSIFFEYPAAESEKRDERFASIDLILWERLSYLQVYPNVSLLRRVRAPSDSSSKSGSIVGIFKRLSKRSKSVDSEALSEVAVLSLPGLTSSLKQINDLGKDVKFIPLASSISLLAQTRSLLFPEGAWYYNYLDGVSLVMVFRMRFVYMC